MLTAKLSSTGHVTIPKEIRRRHHWGPGQELQIIDTNDGLLLRPVSPFLETSMKDVDACLAYSGETKSLRKMEAAIKKGARNVTDESC